MSSYDERITTYFGDAVLRAGFMPVPHLLMRHYRALDLLSEHAMFALQLMEITWDLAHPPATMRKIAERMGISVRTAQRYSEYLAARGLIVIYEQFEEGAQVENGYDLAPLFRALSAFAPEPRPGGAPRERRRRGAAALAEYAGLGGDTDDTPPGDTGDIPPGDTGDIPPGDTGDIPGGDTRITPPHDPPVTPAPTPLSGLKGRQESRKKQQEQSGGAVINKHRGRSEEELPARTARSLRLGHDLAAGDVARSARLLDRIGMHAPVARACAPTLAPAEVLALAAYARAASLGTGWIAAQIYEWERRAPRQADLARRWDEAGLHLAALDDNAALRVLELADNHAPGEPGALLGDAWYAAGDAQVHAAAAAVWALMHHVRGGAPATRTLAATAAAPTARADTALWHAVLARLREEVAAPDYETWLQPARLLLLENDVAIVGTDNIFACEHIRQAHGELLARAFGAERGRATSVDVVID